MAEVTFDGERACPKCGAKFAKADSDPKHEPLVVVSCPGCKQLLWRPGSDVSSPLFVYDPNADAGGI